MKAEKGLFSNRINIKINLTIEKFKIKRSL